jgi:opacity protein-like surface antigen
MKKILFLALLLLALAVPAAAQINVAPIQWEPFIGTDPIDGTTLVGKGYARYAVTTVAKLTDTPAAGVVIHRTARHAILSVETGQVRVRFDGTDPTASEGELYDTGAKVKFVDQRALLLALRMISVSGTASVTVTYGR